MATNKKNAMQGSKSNSSVHSKSTVKVAMSGSNGSKTSSGKKEKTLEDLFEQGLKDVYSAETQLIDALPKMAKAAYSEDLQEAFEKHLQETKKQVERLDKIFSRLNIDRSQIETCAAMEGLIKESNEVIETFEESPVRDSALIIGAQKVEHHEIAAYGSLCELADVLGHGNVMDMLGRTLNEEKDADEKLSSIAKSVNDEAYEMSCNTNEELEEVNY